MKDPLRNGGRLAWLTTLAVAVALAFAGAADAATDPAIICESGKLSTAAKYASCRLKAESKGVKKSMSPDYTRCSLAKFADADTKGGMSCPTTGDQSIVTTYVDTCTAAVATWLSGGGGLPDACAADLAMCDGDLATCEAEPPAQILKTGQTTCFTVGGLQISCAGTAHDGETQNGITRSYTDNGDGTVTDNHTGLMWEKLSDDGSIHDKDVPYTWSDAFATKVATLNSGSFAGYNDWRVPSVMELQSIVNFGAANPSVDTAFDSACAPNCTVTTCSCTQSYNYWASTTNLSVPSGAWIVDFNDGAAYGTFKINDYYVRAVRAGS